MKKLYLGIIFIFAAIAIAGFVFWRYFLQATIILDPVPSEATITVNGRPTEKRTLSVPAGEYTVRVSADGFSEKTALLKVGVGGRVIKRFELEILPRPTQVLRGPISNLQTSNLQVSTKNLEIFFESGGVLYSLPLVGEQAAAAVPITPKLTDLEKISWSPDHQLAVIKKTNGESGLYDFKRYDLQSQEYRKLGDSIKTIAWSNDGNNLFRLEENGGQRLLVRTNRAGAQAVNLADVSALPLRHPNLLTAAGSYLIAFNNPTDGVANLFALDTYQRGVAPITDSGRAAAPVISPDKTHLAYLDNGELVSSTILGQEKRNHVLRPASGAYAFADNSTLVVLSPNTVTLIKLGSGEKQTFQVFAPSDEVNNLFAGNDGKTIYYIYQSSLYSLKFKP